MAASSCASRPLNVACGRLSTTMSGSTPWPFDEPVAVRTEDAGFSRGRDAAIDEEVARRQPDLAAPGARADDLAEPEPPETFGEGLAVRRGVLVAQHHDVPAEGVLHVPRRMADARLPVEPGLAQQLLEDPAVDVAAAVVPHVDDQAVAIEHRIELAAATPPCWWRPSPAGARSRCCPAPPSPPRAGACTPTRRSGDRSRAPA